MILFSTPAGFNFLAVNWALLWTLQWATTIFQRRAASENSSISSRRTSHVTSSRCTPASPRQSNSTPCRSPSREMPLRDGYDRREGPLDGPPAPSFEKRNKNCCILLRRKFKKWKLRLASVASMPEIAHWACRNVIVSRLLVAFFLLKVMHIN